MLALAAKLVANQFQAKLVVEDPVISQATVQDEWDRLLPAIAPEIRARMSLTIGQGGGGAQQRADYRVETGILPLDRTNYRAEVMRRLLGANLQGDGPSSVKHLVSYIGSSQTPVREALAELRQAGVVRSWGRGPEVDAEDVSAELLAKVRASPQMLRFRFGRGAQIKPAAVLLERAVLLLGPSPPVGWSDLALSGVPVAQSQVPALDLIGVPRLDLVAYVPRAAKSFDFRPLFLLDDGLELEPSMLAPAPVVVTLVRADRKDAPEQDERGERDGGLDKAPRCASPVDVFLSLLDMGLREQALQYARAMRE